MKLSRAEKSGFTLIELLVVVSIISLLSTVVLSSVSEARDKAAITKFKEDSRQIGTALELYRSEHGSYPPNDISGTPYSVNTLIENYLGDYINTPNDYGDGITSFYVSSILYYNNPFVSSVTYFYCGSDEEEIFPGYVIRFEASENVSQYFEELSKVKTSTNLYTHYGESDNLFCIQESTL